MEQQPQRIEVGVSEAQNARHLYLLKIRLLLAPVLMPHAHVSTPREFHLATFTRFLLTVSRVAGMP